MLAWLFLPVALAATNAGEIATTLMDELVAPVRLVVLLVHSLSINFRLRNYGVGRAPGQRIS